MMDAYEKCSKGAVALRIDATAPFLFGGSCMKMPKLQTLILDMAKMLVDSMTRPFVPEDFKDEYQARLRDAIMKKIQGKEIVTADSSGPGNVIDLMEALQKSLEISSGKKKKGTA